jgi:hypothetical protein
MASHSSRRLRGSSPGGGLVQQQQAGRAHQAGAQVEAAPHAARIGADQAVGGVGEPERGQHRIGVGRGRAPVEAEQPGHHAQVLPAGHGLFDRGVLAGQADE